MSHYESWLSRKSGDTNSNIWKNVSSILTVKSLTENGLIKTII